MQLGRIAEDKEQKGKGKNKGGGKGKEKGKDKSKDVDGVPKRKRPSSPCDAPQPPPGRPPPPTVTSAAASQDSNSSQIIDLLDGVSDLTRVIAESNPIAAHGSELAGSGAPSSAAFSVAIQPAVATGGAGVRMLQIPLREVQLLYESLCRARRATVRNVMAAEGVAKQFRQESILMERAQAGVKQVLLTQGGQSFVPDVDDDIV